jgi:hypothetical protein
MKSLSILAFGLIFLSLNSFAYDISLVSKVSYTSPCYYTSTSGDFELTLFDHQLPIGTKVELDYGFQVKDYSSENNYDWSYKNIIPFKEVSGVYRTEIKAQTLHDRGASGRLEKVQFVIRITYPDGEIEIDNGGMGAWGYYEATIPAPSNSCNGSVANFTPIKVNAVSRN